MNLYLHLKWLFLECFQNDLLTEAEQSVILLTRENCCTVNINYRHYMYSIKVEKPSEPVSIFEICFLYFISFDMQSFFFLKILNMNQTEVAPNIKVFLHNFPCAK